MSERKQAAIHDLGYKRYIGTRRPQHTRWQVIVRNLLSMSWSGWWRYKAPLGIAVMITVGIGVGIYFSRNEMFTQAQIGWQIRTLADSLIPMSFSYYAWAGFILSLTVLSSAISRDLYAGAFEFYFSRPVRPIDYVLGKVGGATVLLAPILLLGPFLLTVYRLALTGDVDQSMDSLPWLPKAMLVGSVATVAFATLPLAFGALFARPRNATAAFAAYFLLFGGIINGIAYGTRMPDLAALNMASALNGFASGIFDVVFISTERAPSLGASVMSLLGYIAGSIALIFWRVRRAQRAGMGGG